MSREPNKLEKAGQSMQMAGKNIFWLGVCILFTIYIGLPALISLFK